jgi:tetratricopeptide (TPR) repeat protein
MEVFVADVLHAGDGAEDSHVLALFARGRYEECLLALCSDTTSWKKRFQLAAVQLARARLTRNVLELRSVCPLLRRLVAEATTDVERDGSVVNLALCLLSLGDYVAATACLEGVVKALVLQQASRRKRARTGEVEEVMVSASLRLARGYFSLCKDFCSDSFCRLLAFCYTLSGENDAASTLLPNVDDEIQSVVTPRNLFESRQYDECLKTLQGVDCEDVELKGCSLLELGRFEDAIVSLKQSCAVATAKQLKRPNLFHNLLVAVIGAGRPLDDQLALFDVLTRMLRSNVGSREHLAQILVHQACVMARVDRCEDAVTLLDEARAVSLKAADQAVELHVNMLMKLGRFVEALSLLKEGNENLRTECLIRLGRLEELLDDGFESWTEKLSDCSMVCNAALVFLAHGHVSK